MSILSIARTLVFALLLMPLAARAAEPVRSINIYVEPFYRSANQGQPPLVNIGKSFNALLASDKRDDITKARDLILADPKTVTPMAMMVLAIRLYDTGLRDDAVFWFYAAKDRYITFSEVVNTNVPQLETAEAGMKAFATLAGPPINGYAFCDLANQKAIRAKALDWVEANPYEVMFMPQLTAKVPDRRAQFALAIKNSRANAAKERAYFDDPKNAAEFAANRKKNEMDAKYCWR